MELEANALQKSLCENRTRVDRTKQELDSNARANGQRQEPDDRTAASGERRAPVDKHNDQLREYVGAL